MSSAANQIRSVDDARFLAEQRLPRFVRDYIRNGSGTRTTLAANTRAFEEIYFRPRAATAVADPDLCATVLGHRVALPVMIAPTGGSRFVHPDAERAGARAAGRAGTIQWVTTFASVSIEEVVRAASGPVFFQLYYPGSLDAAAAVIERVRAAGCAALALTVDSAVGPRPEVPLKGRITLYRAGRAARRPLAEYARLARQCAARPGWTWGFLRDRGRGLRAEMVSDGGRPPLVFRASEILTRRPPVWDDVPWIKERWAGPLIVKGILTPDDARRAVDCGVDAIVVSNHGGNVLDGDPPAISVLSEIVDAVGGATEILFDSGIRRGSDVVKAMALGARAVLVGRSWLWGLAAAGEAGVAAVLDVYRQQIADTLKSLGCPSVGDLSHTYVTCPSEWSARAAAVGGGEA